MSYATEQELAEYHRLAKQARDAAAKAIIPELRDSFLRIAGEWERLIKAAQAPERV